MKCPVCDNVNLIMSERQGVEIDYCPDCRGIWLDRGELDKIIDKNSQPATQSKPNDDHDYKQRSYEAPRDDQYYKKKKKESFLSELFDF
ncbi:MAG TPA: zf-TFIIB domain-containing protein [Methylotenera sp.]|jgi:Zn-finger nucleic acid-binding protein